MSSKKKTKAKSRANQSVQNKAKVETVKPAEVKTLETKTAEVKNEPVQKVVEWQEKTPEKESTPEVVGNEAKKAHHFGMFLLVLMGILLAATVFVLAICLYDTSKDLKEIQTMSNSLQSEMEQAKQKVEQVEGLLAAVEQEIDEAHENDPDKDSTVAAEEIAKPTATPRPTPEPEVYTVCVDAGHGGYDTGATLWVDEETERREKDDNLWMAELLKKELEAYGVKVIMTREDDTFLELYDRTFIANSMDADALISLHRNAYYLNGKMNDRVSGLEIWVHNSRPADAMQLAGEMLGAMMEVGGMKNRGVKYGSMSDVNENYAINRRAVMTSMIVELGFISNEEDNAALDTYGEAYAKAMATEIYEWLQTLR